MPYFGVLHRYRHLLDIPAHTAQVTLLEGNTLLIPMPRLAEELGGGFELWVKFEGLNPTGSFKDRGMTVAISEAVGREVKSVICASTGNTAASAAAYAARAGLRSIVLIPQGKVAAGKLAGAVAYGAQVIQVEGSFDDALSLVVEITRSIPLRWSIRSIPIAWKGKKPPPSRFATCSSQPRIGCACPWATPETSPPTGWASNNLTGLKRPVCRTSWVCRRPGRPRSSWATR
jgi:threonine synthase